MESNQLLSNGMENEFDRFILDKVTTIYSFVENMPEFIKYEDDLESKVKAIEKLLPPDTNAINELIDSVVNLLDLNQRYFFGYGFSEGLEVQEQSHRPTSDFALKSE